MTTLSTCLVNYVPDGSLDLVAGASTSVQARFDPVCFLQHLGAQARISVPTASGKKNQKPPTVELVSLPEAGDVIAALEETKREYYKSFRESDALNREWLDRVSLALQRFIETGKPTEEMLAAQEPLMYAAGIAISNLFLVYLRTKYNLLPDALLGWHRGMVEEMRMFLDPLPHVDRWNKETRKWFEKLYIAPEGDTGSFVLADEPPSALKAGGEVPKGGRTKRGYRREVPERILYSMSLEEFRELRCLKGENPFEYVGIVFSPKSSGECRMGLQSGRNNNRFFPLVGSLADCLALAQRRKSEIEASPLCSAPFPHDAAGRWKEKICRWLAEDSV